MTEGFITRGFLGKRRREGEGNRLPPGQYIVEGFPVLSAGPTPRTPLSNWTFAIQGLVREPVQWSWEQFQQLPKQTFQVDIHCVTKWSKFDTHWEGVSMDVLLDAIDLDPKAQYLMAFCDGGYTTNLPLADVRNGQAFVAYQYEGQPLPAEHGGPARLVVPHLYFWKSAKWIRGLRLMEHDRPGFWEALGYHDRGDPWKEQRYQGD